jgi:hypothetical protein
MPKEDIRLLADELRGFLATHDVAVLVTEDGGELVQVALEGDELVFAAELTDPRVCVIVEEQPSYRGIKGALVHGEARPLGDGRHAVALDDVASFDFGKLRH